MSTEGGRVGRFVIGRAILPATKQDPDPLVGQRAQRGMMIVAPAPLLVVVRARPRGEANGLVGEFVKGLLDEFRTRQAMVDPQGFATAFGHGRDARV